MNCAIGEHECSNIEFRLAEFVPMEEAVKSLVLTPEIIDDMCVTGHTREEHLRRYLQVKSEVLALQAAFDLYG